jgi:hypothetical protein
MSFRSAATLTSSGSGSSASIDRAATNWLSWPDWVAFGLGLGQALRIVAAASSVTVEVAVPSNSGEQLPKLNVEGSILFTC